MKSHFKYTKPCLSVLIGIAIFLLFTSLNSFTKDKEQHGFRAHRLVSHAMGSINGHTITNSYEAFVVNYEKGSRIFEVDLTYTEDGRLVARHDWSGGLTKLLGQQELLAKDRQSTKLTYAEFRKATINGLYKPLSWDDIIELLDRYPDAYLVTDTKEIKPDEIQRMFSEIASTSMAKDPGLLQRIVPQIYDRPMWDELVGIYPFPNIIYTLYATKDTDEQVIQFAQTHPLTAVTMSGPRANANFVGELRKAGVPTYVNTIDDLREVAKYKRLGVYGFYSDSLTEQDINNSSGLHAFGL